MYFFVLGLLVCLAAPVAADNSKDDELKRFRSEFADKTIRFDEQKLDHLASPLAARNRYIVYFEPDGTAYAWFPSRRLVQAMTWKLKTLGFLMKKSQATEPQYHWVNEMCFDGFLTNKREICRYDSQLKISIQQVEDRDIFDLRSLTVPCCLCQADVDFSTIRKIAGGS